MSSRCEVAGGERGRRDAVRVVSGLFVVSAFSLWLSPPSPGATIRVTSTLDVDPLPAGVCTLREAVEAINAGAVTVSCANEGGEPFGVDDEIVFASELVAETIQLRGEQLPTVTRPVSFVGPVKGDPGGITLDGADASRILDFLGDAPNDFEVSLSYLTLTGGRTEMQGEPGGAVRAENVDLTLDHVLVTGNRTEGVVEPDPPKLRVSGGGGLSVEFGDVFLNNTVVSKQFD